MGSHRRVFGTITFENGTSHETIVWEGSDRRFNGNLDWFSIAVFIACQETLQSEQEAIHVSLQFTDDFGEWTEERNL